MAWLKTLRSKLLVWLASKAIVAARQHLEAKHLGQRLKQALDKQTGFPSQTFERELASYLRTVAQEVGS